MPLLIALLLGLSGVFIVTYPLLGIERRASDPTRSEPLAELAERERTARVALRDLDFDYRLGNLEEGDYESLRDRYESRALSALKTRYEQEQAFDEMIDQQLAVLRNKKTKSAAAPVKSGRNGNASSSTTTVSPSPAHRGGSQRVSASHTVRPRRRKGV